MKLANPQIRNGELRMSTCLDTEFHCDPNCDDVRQYIEKIKRKEASLQSDVTALAKYRKSIGAAPHFHCFLKHKDEKYNKTITGSYHRAVQHLIKVHRQSPVSTLQVITQTLFALRALCRHIVNKGIATVPNSTLLKYLWNTLNVPASPVHGVITRPGTRVCSKNYEEEDPIDNVFESDSDSTNVRDRTKEDEEKEETLNDIFNKAPKQKPLVDYEATKRDNHSVNMERRCSEPAGITVTLPPQKTIKRRYERRNVSNQRKRDNQCNSRNTNTGHTVQRQNQSNRNRARSRRRLQKSRKNQIVVEKLSLSFVHVVCLDDHMLMMMITRENEHDLFHVMVGN